MSKYLVLLLFFFASLVCRAQKPVLNSDKLLDLYQNQKYDEAANYVLSVYPDSITDTKVLLQIGGLKFMAGRLAEAEQYYLKVFKTDSTNISVLNNLAKISIRRENNMLARRYFERIIAQDTTNFNAYKQLADIIYRDEDLRLTYLLKANKYRPEDADVAIDLSTIYNDLKHPELANIVLNFAINADTLNMALLKAKLPVSFKLSKYDETIKTGERLLANGDSTTYVLNNLGKSYYQLKQYENAIKMFEAIASDEQTEGILYYITLCYKQLKNYPEAINYANKTIKESISPNVSRYYMLLGALQENNVKPKAALTAYKKGLGFEDHDNIYYSLGLLYDITLSNKKEAAKNFKAFLSSDADKKENASELKYAKEWLERLKP